MPRLLLKIYYDGENYYGWQRQNTHTTIQKTIEDIFNHILKKKYN